jgi:DNA mismatch endonuclease, patch repair protein
MTARIPRCIRRTPAPLSAVVQKQMRAMPTKNSTPEVGLQKALRRCGLRFSMHASRLPDRPDIVFRAIRLAVFVDGCFWHYCPKHCTLPRHNRGWWRRKLAATRQRDRNTNSVLRSLGWAVVRVWEHDNPKVAARRISMKAELLGLARVRDGSDRTISQH